MTGGWLSRTWLGRLLVPRNDPGAERVRDGQIAATLFAAAAVYIAVVLFRSDQDVPAQIVLLGLVGLSAVGHAVFPWQLMPDRALVVPPVLGVGILTFGYGAYLGQLGHFAPLFGLALTYSGLVLRPGMTVRLTGGALLGLGLAVVLGNQRDHLTEAVGAIVISGLMGELIASAVAVQRRHRADLERLQAGVGALLAAQAQGEASDMISRLAAELLNADGVTVMLREHPGSPVLVGTGGVGLGSGFAELRIDIDAEQSGAGIAARRGRILFVEDAARSPLTSQRFVQSLQAASVLYLPVIGGQEVLGVIAVWWSKPLSALDAFAEQVTRLLSVQAGPVLDRLHQLEVLDRAAVTDPLTGVGNRRAFEQALAAIQAGDWQDGHDEAGLIICDLDRFKALNDTLGHPAGDRVLRAFAAAGAACVRDTGDLVARIGGDEFAFLVRGGQGAVDGVLTRLGLSWTRPEGVGFSAGSAVRRAGEDGQQLSERADHALYEAKRVSRGSAPGGR